jgi:hypothetical protein
MGPAYARSSPSDRIRLCLYRMRRMEPVLLVSTLRVFFVEEESQPQDNR